MLSFADASYHCLVNSECKKASFINLRNAILDFLVPSLICVPSSLYLNFPASSGVFFVNSTIASFDIPSLKIGDAFLLWRASEQMMGLQVYPATLQYHPKCPDLQLR